jgi:hypothetical protein
MRKILPLITLMLLLVYSCDETGIDTSTLQLHVSPDTLYIADSDEFKEVYLSVQPNYKVNYRITQLPAWLKIDSAAMKGTIEKGIYPIRITPLKEGLEGVYTGNISLITDMAGALEIKAIMSVAGHPTLSISNQSIDFGTDSTIKIIGIKNTGTGMLNWKAEKQANWLTVMPAQGTLLKGQTAIVTVICSRAKMDMNTYTSELQIKSNAENQYSNIGISMTVPRISGIALSTPSLTYNFSENEKSIYLINTGNSGMSWSMEPSTYIISNHTTGELAKGDSVRLTLSLDRGKLSNGSHYSKIYVRNDSNKKDSLAVTVNHFAEHKLMLGSNVVDAEFSRAANAIVYVTSSPSNALVIMNPETKERKTVAINKTPTSVAVNTAGTKVLIGHTGMVTYVDVAGLTIEKEYSVECDAIDVVLTSAGWGYMFPRRDQWEAIYGINLLTGAKANSHDWMIYAGMIGKLHPSEKYIYGADNGVSPDDIEKFDVQKGAAFSIKDSPYHGDYPFGGNLWFSEDGDRIYTRSKTILRASEVSSEDMTYNGTISLTNQIQSLFHSKTADRLYILTGYNSWTSTQGDPDLHVFNNSYLNYMGKYTLEQYMVNNKLYNAEGKFVFASANGKRIYVLTKAQANSGLQYDWAFEQLDLKY